MFQFSSKVTKYRTGYLTVTLLVWSFWAGFGTVVNAQPNAKDAAKNTVNQVAGDGGGIYGRLSRSDLEEMLYGVLGGSRQAFRNLRRDTIQRYMDRIHQVCELTTSQREKIEQAIEIDIARTEAHVSSLLSEIQDDTPPDRKQAVYYAAFAELRQSEMVRTDEQGTIWQKVLHATLSSDQLELLAQDDRMIAEKSSQSTRNRLILLCQRRLGLIKSERKALQAFLDQPENLQVRSIEGLQERLRSLSDEERRRVLTDELYDRWKSSRLNE